MNKNEDWKSLYYIKKKIGSGKNSEALLANDNSKSDTYTVKIVPNENYNFNILSSQVSLLSFQF